MNYRWYFDDTPKRTDAEKIEAALVIFRERETFAPNVLLVNEAARLALPPVFRGCRVRSEPYIRINNFWLGVE